MHNFRDLKVWQKAHAFTLDMYKLVATFPAHERYELAGQLRLASYSIPLNLAEGGGYATDKARANSTQIAIGSSCEVEYGLLLARDLGYLKPEQHLDFEHRIVEIRRMLIALADHLRH